MVELELAPHRLTPAQLAARAIEARAMLADCKLCGLSCGIDRAAGRPCPCKLDGRAFHFREMLHLGLEFELIPAHAIYVTGCNMRCGYCNVMEWLEAPLRGEPWDSAALAARVEARRHEGARLLFFVGGEPTLSLPAILELLGALPEHYPIGWDSNMYYSAESRALLQGVVDIYVADFKFGNDACARAIGRVPDYLEILAENLRFAEDTASVMVRHLLMPGHFDCCFLPMLEMLPKILKHPRLSLRGDYLPRATPPRQPELAIPLPRIDVHRAQMAAKAVGVELVA